MSTKSKMLSRRFCIPKKIACTSANQLVGLAKPSLFFSVFRLYFNWRIYKYGDKVKFARMCDKFSAHRQVA